MQRKSQLAGEIARAIKARRLTQEDAATLQAIDQFKVSRIARGQFRDVSEAKLLELVARLDHYTKIVDGPARRRASKLELLFCLSSPCSIRRSPIFDTPACQLLLACGDRRVAVGVGGA